MEFFLMAIVGFLLLALASVILVEGALAIGRIYSRLSFWFRYRHLSWRSGRQVAALKRRFGRRDRSRPSLGQLRFTQSRARNLEELSNGPPEPPHGS
jgi:hypothetical protein